MLKELLYTGLGGAVLLKTKVESELKKLEENGKISDCDVKTILTNLEEKGREEDKKFKESIKQILKETLDEMQVATKEDIDRLRDDLSPKK